MLEELLDDPEPGLSKPDALGGVGGKKPCIGCQCGALSDEGVQCERTAYYSFEYTDVDLRVRVNLCDEHEGMV